MKLKCMQRGLTIPELLVAIGIIGLLLAIVLVALVPGRQAGKIARAQADLSEISIAMELYFGDKGELPPIGDNCSACADPCSTSWTAVVTALVNEGYLSTRLDTDPWGNSYCYDDNYRVADCTLDTPIWSMGPNGDRDTPWANGPPTTFFGDDFGMTIKDPQC